MWWVEGVAAERCGGWMIVAPKKGPKTKRTFFWTHSCWCKVDFLPISTKSPTKGKFDVLKIQEHNRVLLV